MEQYHTADEQDALSKFQQDELAKTKEMDRIEATVPRPAFTNHPPMTPDDAIRYKELRISGVPTTASIFDRPPTVDIGLSLDLSKIPQSYYKYLPILPRCLDSIGLKQGDHVTSYSELSTRIQKEVYAFSVGYDSNPTSKRMELTINASGANYQELRNVLSLIQDIMQFNYLDPANVDRLRDILARRLSADESYTRGDTWTENPAYAFRYQDDALFLALYSHLTRSHWDARLRWLLHEQADPEEINGLSAFADGVLGSDSGLSKQALSQKLAAVNAKGLQGELIDYLRRNLDSFPGAELHHGLVQLTTEVQADLRKGPVKTIEELKALQKIIFDRGALHLNVTVDRSTLDRLQSDLKSFLNSISRQQKHDARDLADEAQYPIIAKLERRYGLASHDFPWYVQLANPNGITGNVTFYSDFYGYSHVESRVAGACSV